MPLRTDFSPSGEPVGGRLAGDWYGIDAIEHTKAITAVASYPVDVYGADPTGVGFSDAAVAAAITAMGTAGGLLTFGIGTYKLSSTKTLSYPGQGIHGQGAGATKIDWTGSGDCFRVWDSTVPTDGSTSPRNAGPITGFTIDGTNSSGSVASYALHIGDLYGIHIQNVAIKDFNTAGSIGFWGENRYSWSERAHIQMQVDRAATCYMFDRNASHPNAESSWDYSSFNLSVVINANQNGLIVKNNTDMLGIDMVLWGNCHSAVTNTGTLIIIGTTGGDASYIKGGLQIWGEAMGGTGVYHTDINIGAAARLEGVGILQFITGYSFVAGTASRYNTKFSGRINCPSLGYMAGSQGLRTTGVVATTPGAGDGAGHTHFYLAEGNTFYQLLPGGANAVTFDVVTALAGQATTYDFVLQQPVSGGACTLTWPGSVVWVAGNAPVLSAANSALDYIRLVTTDHTTFYGVQLKSGTQFVTEYVGTTTVSSVAVPAGVKTARLTVIPPGSGGGSGRRGAAGTVRCGGGSAGSSGAIYDFSIPAATLGSTFAVTIPAPGAGGAAVTTNDTNGNAGTRPAAASFVSGSATVSAAAGDAGGGGTATTGAGGAFAGGGFAPSGPVGASASTSGGAGNSGNDSHFGTPAVGGTGGGITSVNVAGAGGAGGSVWEPFNVFGGSAGVVAGASPGAGSAAVAGQAGAGAGGGAASITTAAQAGANAVGYGAGGSGGGASLNGNNSGKGGDGGPGYVRIVWEF